MNNLAGESLQNLNSSKGAMHYTHGSVITACQIQNNWKVSTMFLKLCVLKAIISANLKA